MRDGDLKFLLFYYWIDFAPGSVETNFLENGAYVSRKRAATSAWESRLSISWAKILLHFNYKYGGVGPKTFSA